MSSLIGAGPSIETIAYHDAKARHHRFASYDSDTLLGALYLAPEPVLASREWAIAQLLERHKKHRARLAVIAGRPGKGAVDRGQIVCSCFGIGAGEIAAAAVRGCTTLASIGEALQAGTNCGSCRAEIRSILERARSDAQSERALVAPL
jgi:assimilatory nitrate reductase catalytic subunit